MKKSFYFDQHIIMRLAPPETATQGGYPVCLTPGLKLTNFLNNYEYKYQNKLTNLKLQILKMHDNYKTLVTIYIYHRIKLLAGARDWLHTISTLA